MYKTKTKNKSKDMKSDTFCHRKFERAITRLGVKEMSNNALHWKNEQFDVHQKIVLYILGAPIIFSSTVPLSSLGVYVHSFGILSFIRRTVFLD